LAITEAVLVVLPLFGLIDSQLVLVVALQLMLDPSEEPTVTV
jgi:hypothetical protein